MEKQRINIVWLKRDLRIRNHLPFSNAETSEIPYLAIYTMEPTIINYKDTSLRHLQFIFHSIKEMNVETRKFNQKAHLCFEEALIVFKKLQEEFSIVNIFSYQEILIQLT